MSRVVLAMSGGVDSSVAAHLLLRQGHRVTGVFMRHGEPATACHPGQGTPAGSLPVWDSPSSHEGGCCSAADAADARRVADLLQMPFYALDFRAEFGHIIDYFVDQYAQGRTPNPCVVCNHRLKFGRLFDYADSIGAELVATGHYARQEQIGGQAALLCGVDPAKDQSYVLFGVRRDRLPRMALPLGGYRKAQIRQLAAELGWRVADKRDSQEICFVASGKHGEFVRARCGGRDASGPIVTTDGRVVGRHNGLENFTIGQRKKLGVALGEPFFVVRIEPDERRVVIGRREELARGELTASDVNWLVAPGSQPFRCQAKIRYNSPAASAVAQPLPGNRLRVTFDHPRYAIAPGQAVVCYDGPRVVCGGWID